MAILNQADSKGIFYFSKQCVLFGGLGRVLMASKWLPKKFTQTFTCFHINSLNHWVNTQKTPFFLHFEMIYDLFQELKAVLVSGCSDWNLNNKTWTCAFTYPIISGLHASPRMGLFCSSMWARGRGETYFWGLRESFQWGLPHFCRGHTWQACWVS